MDTQSRINAQFFRLNTVESISHVESGRGNNNEFTQQDCRKKRTAKRLSVTNVTGILIACFVANSLNIYVSCSSTKRSVQRNVKFGGSKGKAKLFSSLSQKVCRCLSSPVLLRKFTNNGTRAKASLSDKRQPEVDFLHSLAVALPKF